MNRATRWVPVVFAALAAMLLTTPHASAEPLPPTTTAAEAQADPIWAEMGYNQIGAVVSETWLSRAYWDTPHTYQTQGTIDPVWSSTASAALPVRFKHMDGVTEISSIHLSIDTANPANGLWVVDAFLPGTSTAAGRFTGAVVEGFSVDPLGWLAGKFADAAVSLLGWISTEIVRTTQPDLTAAWWKAAYAKGFAVGTILYGFILAVRIARLARQRGGDEIVSLGGWTVAYFGGVAAGPFLGSMLIDGSGYLTNGIIAQWGGTGPADAVVALQAAVVAASTGSGIGGIVLALLTIPAVLIAAFFVFISLVLQGVVLYLSSALFALGFVWVLSKRYRPGGLKVPLLFAGLCASKPLLFLMLGIGFDMVRSVASSSTAQNLSTMVMAFFVMLLAAFAPLILLKFAAVLPSGSEAATGATIGGLIGGGLGGSTAEIARQRQISATEPGIGPGGVPTSVSGVAADPPRGGPASPAARRLLGMMTPVAGAAAATREAGDRAGGAVGGDRPW